MKKILLLFAITVVSISTVLAQKTFTDTPTAFKIQKMKVSSHMKNIESASLKKSNSQKAPASNEAFYTKPYGTYYAGISKRFGTYPPIILGPISETWEYQKVTQNTNSFTWFISETDVTEYANEKGNLLFGSDEENGYIVPTLNTTVGSKTSSYSFAEFYSDTEGTIGGTALVLSAGNEWFMSNALIHTDSTTNGYDFFGGWLDGGYMYGSGIDLPDGDCIGFEVEFEKPLANLVIDTIYIPGFSESDNPLSNKSLQLTVVTNAGVIATSSVSSSDLLSLGDGDYTIPFAFKTVDEFGFETPSSIVLADTFYVYVTGFEQTGVDLGLFCSTYGFDNHETKLLSSAKSYSYTSFQGNIHMVLEAYFDPSATPTLPSSVSTQKVQLSKITNIGSDYSVTYPSDFTSLKVYSSTGQLVNQHLLPSNGSTTIPSSHLTKGIYFFKFEGSKTETVKVMK